MKSKTIGSRDWTLAGFFLALTIGSALAWGADSSLDWNGIVLLRLPRVLLAAATGAALALSGTLLQSLFRNPLCEPYTLGVSSGAAFGAVVGHSFGFRFDVLGVSLGGLLGALVVALILILVGKHRKIQTSHLLLVGVMLTFTGSSLVALWIALQDSSGVQSTLGWLLGDLSRADLRASLTLAWVVLALGFFVYRGHRDYDALWLGEDEARSLGVDPVRARNRIVLATSILVGLSVASSGMIGFLGLIVSHVLRLTGSALHARVLPLSLLWGAAVLVVSDLGARVIVKPYEIPVGVVTALVGGPLFIVFLFRRRVT